MELLFVADPLEQFKIYKDTTFSMMREAQRRGHTLLGLRAADLGWQRGGRVTARGARHHADRRSRRVVPRPRPSARAALPTSTRC